MNNLLEQIADQGWTQQRMSLFVKQYDKQIREQILMSMVKFGFIASESELHNLRRYIHEQRAK